MFSLICMKGDEMNECLSVVKKASLGAYSDDQDSAWAILPEHLPVVFYTIHQAVQSGKVFWLDVFNALWQWDGLARSCPSLASSHGPSLPTRSGLSDLANHPHLFVAGTHVVFPAPFCASVSPLSQKHFFWSYILSCFLCHNALLLFSA